MTGRPAWLLAVMAGSLASICAAAASQRSNTLEGRVSLTAPSAPTSLNIATSDGELSHIRVWPSIGRHRLIVVAVHGLNDHGSAFVGPARSWSSSGITTYAIDLRGFGRSGQLGRWSGRNAVVGDVTTLVKRVRRENPRTPIVLFGESFGASVAILSASQLKDREIAGLVLSAPAVLRPSLPNHLMRRLASAVGSVTPGITIGPVGHDRPATDDPEMLRRLSSDPLIQRRTRLDLLSGVVDLMSEAPKRISGIKAPILIMLGDLDTRVSRPAILDLTKRVHGRAQLALYPGGPHLLLRSLQRDILIADTTAWMLRPGRALPSAADARGKSCADFIDDPAGRCAVALRTSSSRKIAAAPAPARSDPKGR